MYQNSNDLLMDVDELDFLDSIDGKGSSDLSNNEGTEVSLSSQDTEEYFERDPVTGDLVMNLTKPEDLPLSKADSGQLKFKQNTIAEYNLAYVTKKDVYKLYPVNTSTMVDTHLQSNYIINMFDIYQKLGEHRSYNLPTVGVINSTSQHEHTVTVNEAMAATVSELEMFIETAKENDLPVAKYIDLEDSLNILHCLSTIHFTVDSSNGPEVRTAFLKNLLEWINRADGEPSPELIERTFSNGGEDTPCYQNIMFWKLLNQLLLRGLFEQAIGCIERSDILSQLKSTCTVSFDALTDLVELIRSYPMDDDKTFREWKAMVLELSQTFSNSQTSVSGELRDYIEDTLLLISGDRFKILNYSKTWYESFCGFILFYIPTLELTEEYLKVSTERNPIDLTNNWEESCAAIIRGDVYSILPTLESLNNCTATFTAALCEAKGLLRSVASHDDNDTRVFRETKKHTHGDKFISNLVTRKEGIVSYMMNNFAFELCSTDDKNLWPVAIGLISLVPATNVDTKRITIGELLQHYPYQTNDDIEWLLSVCAEWKLSHVTKSLYTRLGTSMMDEGKTIEAIANFSKAGRFDRVIQYTWTLFEASVIQGEPLEDEILNAIIQNDELSLEDNNYISEDLVDSVMTKAMRQTLSPYAVLYRFYEAMANDEPSIALDLLMRLITFSYLPDYYVVMLVTKFLYPLFLSEDDTFIDEETVVKVIDILEAKWDSKSVKSANIYRAVLESDMALGEDLPDNLAGALKIIRQQLNYKLCQEFM